MNGNGYKYLIFDIDDTLLDFGSAFFQARKNVAVLIGVECTEEYNALDEKTGWKAWNEMRMDDTEDPDVQKNYHRYYYEYLHRHFGYVLNELNMKQDVDALVDCYLESVTSSSVLQESCTLDVIRELSQKYSIELASNGITDMQTKRSAIFQPYIDRIYVSEEIGAIKPTKAFFEYILQDLKCDPKECLMIGDSYTNDIVGAKRSGMATCYFNPKKKTIPDDSCDHVIESIGQLRQLLLQESV